MFIGTGNTGVRFTDSSEDIRPVSSSGANLDATLDLGVSGCRFKDLHLSGGVLGDTLTFKNNNGTEKARLDSSGNLLVGTTNNVVGYNNTDNGIALRGQAGGFFSRNSSFPIVVNRNGTDGEIINLRHDGLTVGEIGSRVGYLNIGTGDTGLLFNAGGDVIQPESTTGGARGDAIDLGASGARFKDLYLSGGVYLGGTGSANKLDDYETGNFTPVASFSSSNGTLSYNAQVGYYVKTGKTVNVHLHLAFNKGTASGNFRISGLPFTIANNQAARGGASVGFYNGINNANSNPLFMGDNNTTIISSRKPDSADIADTDLDSTVSVWLQYTYYI
jgi:hypothetical protein